MASNPKRVLFVDDDEPFLELARRATGGYGGGRWETLTASSAGNALEMLKSVRVEVIAIDLNMPVLSGLQLLGLIRRGFPNIIKVILTGDESENARSDSLTTGADLFLCKPHAMSGWKDVFVAFDELVKLEPENGFRGILQQASLQDIVQLSCLARHSIVMRIRSRQAVGSIYIREGEIIHAQCGEHLGTDAFNDLLSLKGGEFELEPYLEPPQQSIQDQWEMLVMEAARKNDENGQPPRTGNTELLALLTASARKPANEVAFDTGAFRFSQAAHGKNLELQPRIDEFVLFTPEGQLLHDWQCSDYDARQDFVEALTEKVRQLGQLLPMGEFDRLEVNGPKARLVTIVGKEQSLFVRTSRGQ